MLFKAIILLIMNIRFGDSGFWGMLQSLIKGKYYDITPLWFEGVAPIILLTMFINIFSTPLFVLTFHIIRLISRARDQSLFFSINNRK